MLNITRSTAFASLALAFAGSVFAASYTIEPQLKPEVPSAEVAEIIAHSRQSELAEDCVSNSAPAQRTDRLATMMLQHSMVSRLTLNQEAITRLAEEGSAASHTFRHKGRICG